MEEIRTTLAGLASATKFIGVKNTLPTTGNNGDICIVGNKEYIYSTGSNKWVELGDVSEEKQRLTNVEEALAQLKNSTTTSISNLSKELNNKVNVTLLQ